MFDNGGLDDHFVWGPPFDCAWIPCRASPPKEARLSAAIRWPNMVDISGAFQDLEAGLGSPINIPGRCYLTEVQGGCRRFLPSLAGMPTRTVTYHGSVRRCRRLKSGRSSSC